MFSYMILIIAQSALFNEFACPTTLVEDAIASGHVSFLKSLDACKGFQKFYCHNYGRKCLQVYITCY